MPDETVVVAEPTMEEQLAELEKSIKAEEAVVEEPKAEEPKVKTPAPEPPAPKEQSLEDKLKEIEEPAKVDEQPKPQAVLSPETEQELTTLRGLANGYTNFTGTLEKGDYAQSMEMLQQWNPKVVDGLLEHIYAKNIEEWTDRWIAEQDNPAHKHIRSLANSTEQRIAQLEQQLADERQTKTTQAQREAQANTLKSYNDHLTGLFDKISFSPNDRKWVLADIHNRVASDSKIQQAVSSGQLNAVNSIFKTAVKEYVERDKATTQAKEKVLDKQAERKAPIQASPLSESVAITDDQIRQAPRDKRGELRDAQQEAELAKFFGSLTRKR